MAVNYTTDQAPVRVKFADGETPEPLWTSPDGHSSLYVGEATKMLSGIPTESIDCVWTDPPYLLSNGGVTCVAGRMVSVDKGEWDKSKGVEADYEFNEAWTKECYRVLKPAGTIWVSGTLHIYPSIGMALLRNGFRLLNDIIWEKPNPPPNLGRRTFTHSTEVVFWASKAPKGSRHKYTFNYEDMKRENGGKQMKTVWRFTTAGRKEKQFGKHPTQKPIALIDRCIRASTHPNDIVLDPFAGTASTGVAALKVGRRFIGIEVDESYAEIGVKRLSEIYPPPVAYQATILADTNRKTHLILQDCSRGEAEIWPGAILAQAMLWSVWYSPRWKWVDTKFGGASTSVRALESVGIS